MIYLYILSTLLIAFFLIRNCVSQGHYKARSSQALLVFDDTRRFHKISRIVFSVLFVLMIVILVVYLLTNPQLDILHLSIIVCLILCFALFGFVPYTPGRWTVQEDGIYIYNQDRFIPYSELIACRLTGEGKKTYLQLDLLKTESDRLKKGTYLVMIPPEKARDTADMIREFIVLEDKARAKRRRQRLAAK